MKSHDKAKRQGYYGASTTGLNISYCSNVSLSKIELENIVSSNNYFSWYKCNFQ